ncbi:hypothetical protein SAMN06265222_101682 [Neorhodopirellula lusitana]|uniref:Pilus assembly protein n=1 Tax=Neorhodopirellula lusitana TaxID=445327 RepID=A0ABY1PPY3_9BACT|nr:hypothetical protein [Neorhodopirellula lusitana]SMP41939.1 hypothetical protein SAMN06265222_101682 [Neorhodopirellula lusitana]
MNHIRRSRLPVKRLGASLIDVAAGAAVLSLLLIPAMQLMGHSAQRVSTLAVQDALLFEGERAIETRLIELSDASAYDRAVSSIDVAVKDNHSKQYRTQMKLSKDPQIADLMTIECVAYQDSNSNGKYDTDEIHQTLTTQWCRPR